MMNNFWDDWGLLHHKPTRDSNNGWIYTAYFIFKKLKPPPFDILETFKFCTPRPGENYRRVDKQGPPISHDEITGMYAIFGEIAERRCRVIQNDWFLDIESKKRYEDSTKFFSHLFKLAVNWKNRNYHWENKLYGVWNITRTYPLTQRHYLLKKFGGFNLLYFLLFYLNALFTTLSSNKSAKNLLWLMLKDIKSPIRTKFYPDYFDYPDHPLRLE